MGDKSRFGTYTLEVGRQGWLGGILKPMADFKNIQKFVALVDEYNTRDDKKRDLPLVSLADENYRVNQAMKKDNALNAFVKDCSVKNPKAVEIFEQAEELEFIQFMSSQDESPNPRVAGEIILIPFKGKELIRKPWVLHRFLAWLDYRNKLAVLAIALIGAGILGNINYIVGFFQWLF